MAELYCTIFDDFCFSLQIQYTAEGKENLQNYNLVTDTPVYVTALQSGINASEVCLSYLLFQNKPLVVFMYFQTAEIITHHFLSVGEI